MGVVISSTFLRSSTFLPLILSLLRIPYLEAYSMPVFPNIRVSMLDYFLDIMGEVFAVDVTFLCII